MRLELTGRHLTITPAIRTVVQQRLAPVLRKLNDSAVSAHVVLTQQKVRAHADVTLHIKGVHFLHGEAAGRDVAAALGGAVDKIERQGEKLKGKWNGGRKGGSRVATAATEPPLVPREATRGPRIIRTRRYAVKPMSIDDAATLIGDGGDAVLVFRNDANGGLTILFRRPDGNLGLIEPEA
jgi:putative sigma-54 modulation protein